MQAVSQPLRALALIVLAGSALAACADGPARYRPMVTDPATQQTRRHPQVPADVVASQHPESAVFIFQGGTPELARWGTLFNVTIANRGQAPVAVGVANMTFRQGGQRLPARGVTEVNQAIEESNRSAQAHAATVAVMGAMLGGMSAMRPTATTPLTMSTTMMSIQVSSMSAQQTVADNAAAGSEVARGFFSTVTIPPGSQATGLVAVPNLDAAAPVDVEVAIGAQLHRLRFLPDASGS
jgi:hypothetical protein